MSCWTRILLKSIRSFSSASYEEAMLRPFVAPPRNAQTVLDRRRARPARATWSRCPRWRVPAAAALVMAANRAVARRESPSAAWKTLERRIIKWNHSAGDGLARKVDGSAKAEGFAANRPGPRVEPHSSRNGIRSTGSAYLIVGWRRANQRAGFRAADARFVEPLGRWTRIGRVGSAGSTHGPRNRIERIATRLLKLVAKAS
jgi:hypothetical protein